MALAVSFQSCTGNKPCDCSSLAGEYSYYTTDSLGSRLLEGKVTFKEVTKGNYSMSFHIENQPPDFPGIGGFRSSNPRVAFNVTNRKAYITMSPVESDYSVTMELDLVGNSLVGEWTHSTMRGVINKGRFYGNRISF